MVKAKAGRVTREKIKQMEADALKKLKERDAMKPTNDKQPKPSRVLRSARRHDALTEALRSKLKTREKALKTELAEVRKHLKKPDVKVDEVR